MTTIDIHMSMASDQKKSETEERGTSKIYHYILEMACLIRGLVPMIRQPSTGNDNIIIQIHDRVAHQQ